MLNCVMNKIEGAGSRFEGFSALSVILRGRLWGVNYEEQCYESTVVKCSIDEEGFAGCVVDSGSNGKPGRVNSASASDKAAIVGGEVANCS